MYADKTDKGIAFMSVYYECWTRVLPSLSLRIAFTDACSPGRRRGEDWSGDFQRKCGKGTVRGGFIYTDEGKGQRGGGWRSDAGGGDGTRGKDR